MATTETVVEGCSHLSEEILDKLHMLGYDNGFLRQKSGFKPLTADYFAIEINGNEQFNYFKALVKWLFSLNDIMSQDFDSFEDPNTVAQNMQFELRKLSVNVDVIASKIKKGSGEHVCEVLLGLIDATIKKRRVQFNSPVFPKQDDNSKMQKDIGGEDDDSVEIEGAGVAEDEDGDEVDLANYANKENKQVIESKANEKEWKNEVDKVRRQLESFTGVDQKEWRHHIENSKELTEKIGNEKPRIQAALEKLCDMMDKQLDRIGSREREINKVMVEIGEEFKNKSERYKELQTDIDVRTVRVKKLNDEYIALSAKNDQLQAKLSTLTNTTTNNQPLIQIKETIKHLRLEIQQMDVRIGVLNNIVWRHDFETRKQQLEETTGGRRNQERDFMRDTPDIAELDEEDEN